MPRTRSTILFVTVAVAGAWLVAFPGSPVVATAQAHCRAARQEGEQLSKAEARSAVRCLLNAKRRKHGQSALGTNARLQAAAQKHTEYMRSHGCFAHQCPGEGSLLARLSNVGYLAGWLHFWGYGENIVWGPRDMSSPRDVVRAWMRSAPHRANILKGSFRDLGIGFVRGTPTSPSSDGAIYTTDFGYRG